MDSRCTYAPERCSGELRCTNLGRISLKPCRRGEIVCTILLLCASFMLLLSRAPPLLPLLAFDVDVILANSATSSSRAAFKLIYSHDTARGIHTLNSNVDTENTYYPLVYRTFNFACCNECSFSRPCKKCASI